jgi:hypothetical protein
VSGPERPGAPRRSSVRLQWRAVSRLQWGGEIKLLIPDGPMQGATRSIKSENELYIKLFITNGGGW